MAAPIDFYFDFSSAYGYLMSEKIDALAARHGREVRWHAVLLGAIFKVTGGAPLPMLPLKGEYAARDMPRSARFHAVPFSLPANFPIATQAAARAFYWLSDQDAALGRRFAQAAYRAYFVDGTDISAPQAVIEVAKGLGVDAAALETALGEDAVKARLKHACEAAIETGVFGSPFVIIDGEPFWGIDRLPQIERWLETGAF